MKKLDLKNMSLLTSDFQTKIVTNYKDEDGEKMYLEVKGLSIDDFGYLTDKIPQQTILNFVEGFSEKDVEDLNKYIIDKTQKSFSDIFYSIIAAGSGLQDQEETLKIILTTPQALKAFKAIIRQTLPQNQEELEEVKEALDKMAGEEKKIKAIMNCFKNIVEIIVSN